MRPTHYLRKAVIAGDVERLPFKAEHFREAGLSPAMAMPQLEAYQLINRMNLSQSGQQRYVYALE